jgi:hypothetical protein
MQCSSVVYGAGEGSCRRMKYSLGYFVHWQSATRCLVTECLQNNSAFSAPTSVWYENLKYSDPWQVLDLSRFSVSHRNRSRPLWTYFSYFDTYEIAFFILGFPAINCNERILFFLYEGVEKILLILETMSISDTAVSYINNLNTETMGYDAFQFGTQCLSLTLLSHIIIKLIPPWEPQIANQRAVFFYLGSRNNLACWVRTGISVEHTVSIFSGDGMEKMLLPWRWSQYIHPKF